MSSKSLSFLFANVPTLGKRAEVSAEELKRPMSPTRSFAPLDPTDPPPQKVKTIGPEGSDVPDINKPKEARAMACLYLAGLTKQACEFKRYDRVAQLTKIAGEFAISKNLPWAVAQAYPDESPEKQAALVHAILQGVKTKHAEALKDAGWLRDAAGWLEEAPGKAWGAVKNTASEAWDGVTGAVDRNIVQPVKNTYNNAVQGVSNAYDSAKTTANNALKTVTDPIHNAVEGTGRVINGVSGAIDQGLQGVRNGWNGAQAPQAQAGALPPQQPAPAPAPIKPPPAPPAVGRSAAFGAAGGALGAPKPMGVPGVPKLASTPGIKLALDMGLLGALGGGLAGGAMGVHSGRALFQAILKNPKWLSMFSNTVQQANKRPMLAAGKMLGLTGVPAAASVGTALTGTMLGLNGGAALGNQAQGRRPKLAESTLTSVPHTPAKPQGSVSTPAAPSPATVASKPRRQVRYSFRGTPANANRR